MLNRVGHVPYHIAANIVDSEHVNEESSAPDGGVDPESEPALDGTEEPPTISSR